MRICATSFRILPTLLLIFGLAGCGHRSTNREQPQPPVAKRVPVKLTLHGDTRVDDYYWIRDDSRSKPDVLKLLNAENKYTDAVMAPTKKLQEVLFDEIAGRLQVADKSVPVQSGDYLYHREFQPGHQYPIYVRSLIQPGAQTQVMLDVNTLSIGHDYYHVGNWSVSPNNQVLAFAEDTVGRRQYTIRFKNLANGEYLPDKIEGAGSDLAWANDNRTLFYVHKDPETLRSYEVFSHQLGTPVASDRLVYREQDPAWRLSVYATRENDYVVIEMQSTDSTEIRLVDASQPAAAPKVFLKRQPHLQYQIRHTPGWFYIITNWHAENFRLMKTPDDKLGDISTWQDVIPARPDVRLDDVEVFSHYLALNESVNGLSRLRVIDRDTGLSHSIPLSDPTYTVRLYSNPQFDATGLRYAYSSLTTPESIYEYDMARHTTRLLKRQKISGGFDPLNYASKRIFIMARDGTKVPVSLVYRKDLRRPGKNPLFVTGYGAYGIPDEASFQSRRLSLLDRGFVYAIVHVRGGDEMGQAWYDQGRLLHKRNTFNDFIDATRALVRRGYGKRGEVFASGGSAGGLLMGVVANEAPSLYLGIIARVPFVDVVTTMSDASIPLTSGEFREWGNPGITKDYRYMLSYSPYDQVKAQRYPNMFVTAALYDSQVQYYGPVKWISKLRHFNTGRNLLLLHVNMHTGHDGASSRYDRYRLQALEYAFVLDVLRRKRS